MTFEQALAQALAQAKVRDRLFFVYIDRSLDNAFHWCTEDEYRFGSRQWLQSYDVFACAYPEGTVEYYNE